MTNKSFLVRSVRIAVVWIPAFVARTDGYTYTKTSEQETWDCVDASMKTLNLTVPNFIENFNALFNNSDSEYEKWEECQSAVIFSKKPVDATCSYDYQTDPLFQSVVLECKNARGVMYVADCVVECAKPEYSIAIVTRNDPYCIVPELKECESIDNLIITPDIPFETSYNNNGYSCYTTETELHVFKEDTEPPSKKPASPSPKINEVTVSPIGAPDDDSNLPMIIGVAVAAVAAVIGGGVFVYYVRCRRNQQKSDQSSRNQQKSVQNPKGATLQQGDIHEERIDAITQAVQTAATNAVRQAVLEIRSIPAAIDVPAAEAMSLFDMASAPVATASVLECTPMTIIEKEKDDKWNVEV